MRAIVTCEGCRHRQWLLRPIDAPQSFHVICHNCERVLQVAVTDHHLLSALASVPSGLEPPGQPPLLEEGGPWSGRLDAGPSLGGWSAPLV
ncbi:MAG: hypothetical protein ABR564_00535 [Candidatus Dormibacteria bacterium]